MDKETKKKQIKLSIIISLSVVLIPALIIGIIGFKQDLDKKKQIAAEEARLAAQVEVPNVVGQSKSSAISKLEGAGLKYNVSTKYHNSVPKNTVISQSISAGSKVGAGTTVSIIVSLGKQPAPAVQPSPSPSTAPVTPPAPVCENVTVWIDNSFFSSTPSTTCNNVKAAYPKLKFSCSYVSDPGLANGLIKNNGSIDGNTFSTCTTVNLQIVSN